MKDFNTGCQKKGSKSFPQGEGLTGVSEFIKIKKMEEKKLTKRKRNIAYKHRNKAICFLRHSEWTMYAIQKALGIDKRNLYRIWRRDQNKYLKVGENKIIKHSLQ